MKEKVMQGKPYAGNPHVRFDEGAGAPTRSGRSALLYKKTAVLALALLAYVRLIAAPAHWAGISLSDDGIPGEPAQYFISSDIYGANGEYTWILSFMAGHMEDGGFLLKHKDFSSESMEPTFNWWALASYGDIVDKESFSRLTPIELFYVDDYYSGGTLIENPSDFYMVFKASEVLIENGEYVEGMTWYGWVHVSVDENLYMTLLDDGINLDGGPVTVGIPEPSSALLLLLGCALMALRRYTHRDFLLMFPIRAKTVCGGRLTA